MDAVVLPKSTFDAIEESLKEIKEHVRNINSPSEHFIDNKTFMALMGVSDRTALTWRNKGHIGFSQEGKKIYYRMSDIDQFMLDHHQRPFADPSKLP